MPSTTRRFDRVGSLPLPDLYACQRRAYERLFAPGVGLDAAFRDAFPIRSHDATRTLCYEGIEMGEPALDVEACRARGASYTRPLFLHLRLAGTDPISERIAFAQIPILLGGGEYLINGVERVVVPQFQRCPGVEFGQDDGQVYCRFIVERGCQVTIAEGRGVLEADILPGGKVPALTLLRALSPEGSDGDILRRLAATRTQLLHPTLSGTVAEDVLDPQTGEVLLEVGEQLTSDTISALQARRIESIEVMEQVDELLLTSLRGDPAHTHEEALLEVHRVLRKGMPGNLDRARITLREKFADPMRFRLGRAGRFRIARQFGSSGSDALTADDVSRGIRYLLELRYRKGEIDDVDHLANRRVRLVDELLCDAVRKSLGKLRRVVQDRMRKAAKKLPTALDLVNPRTVAAAVEHFFCRSEFSQLSELTNPLAQAAQARRFTAMGAQGRTRARFDARGVHVSHLGRLCPVETPEGESIGLISHLALYADVDELGFIVTPYREVVAGRITGKVQSLRADEEVGGVMPADALSEISDSGMSLAAGEVIARDSGEFELLDSQKVAHLAVSPAQQLGLSAALIPFLEHDDANRALMGSNMQRQAVPLMRPEVPIVGTGLETETARQSSLVVRAAADGVVTFVDAGRIIVGERVYSLRKFASASGVCLNQKPIVCCGEAVRAGQVIADGPATREGQLALGRNVLVAFMTWHGYNYEDAIVVSERLVREDVFTSLHVAEFTHELHENRAGEEAFTARVPGVGAQLLRHLGDDGVARQGSRVLPGDVLVGKTIPRTRDDLTPEERTLRALKGQSDVVGDSLVVPGGVEGVVIEARRETTGDLGAGVRQRIHVRVACRRPIAIGDKMAGRHGNKGVISKILPIEDMPYLEDGTPVDILLNPLGVPSRMNVGQILETHLGWAAWKLGFRAITPVFDGASEAQIRACLQEAKLPGNGKTWLYDGQSGARFEQPVTVGILYMLKLHHLAEDKVHARATGPYSLITQQPLGGKAREGGQRLGEMEVWALEAYGASATLREMLTLKSDDVEGRAQTYQALVRGDAPPQPGTPASVAVLRQELRGLGIDLELES